MKLLLTQGRALKPVENKIQEFPDNWIDEFNVLNNIADVFGIEWIMTDKAFKNINNFNIDGLPVFSICVDNIINDNFTELSFLKDNFEPVLRFAEANNIGHLTIPLLEKSSISDKTKRDKFIESFFSLIKKDNKIILSFEFESDLNDIMEVVVNHKTCRLTYDTGNLTTFHNKNIHNTLLFESFNYISNVHLKDKDLVSKKTVPPGRGSVDFKSIFSILKKENYSGYLTLQTAREEDGEEVKTLNKHVEYFNTIWEQ